jgi:hypothetical protein
VTNVEIPTVIEKQVSFRHVDIFYRVPHNLPPPAERYVGGVGVRARAAYTCITAQRAGITVPRPAGRFEGQARWCAREGHVVVGGGQTIRKLLGTGFDTLSYTPLL